MAHTRWQTQDVKGAERHRAVLLPLQTEFKREKPPEPAQAGRPGRRSRPRRQVPTHRPSLGSRAPSKALREEKELAPEAPQQNLASSLTCRSSLLPKSCSPHLQRLLGAKAALSAGSPMSCPSPLWFPFVRGSSALPHQKGRRTPKAPLWELG